MSADSTLPIETPIPVAAPTGTPPGMGKRRIARSRAVMVLCALLFATVTCLSMIRVGSIYLGDYANTFLIWNLTLAWIPMVCAFAAYRFYAHSKRRDVLFVLCALGWFFFFPNAPYILTDFVHLRSYRRVVLWYDLLTISSFAWTGLCLGYLSLYLMQEVIRARFGAVMSWVFVVAMLTGASVGVYMGRFLRWNSWDVVRHPFGLIHEGLKYVDDPWSRPGVGLFVGVMFLFLLFSYCVTFALTHLHGEAIPVSASPAPDRKGPDYSDAQMGQPAGL